MTVRVAATNRRPSSCHRHSTHWILAIVLLISRAGNPVLADTASTSPAPFPGLRAAALHPTPELHSFSDRSAESQAPSQPSGRSKEAASNGNVSEFESAAGEARSEWDLATVGRVLRAIGKGVAFIGRAYRNVNLDAVIGTRMLEGQLERVLESLETAASSPASSVDRRRSLLSRGLRASLTTLLRRSTNISDSAERSVQRMQRVYYQRIGIITQRRFWRQNYPSRDIDPTRILARRLDGEAMNEAQSDDCLTELFATGAHSGGEKCVVSRACWTLMTSPGYGYYSLTHQAFYLMIGETVGCFDRSLTEPLNTGFCANILVEAEGIASQGYPPDRQDLFMEQAALCGLLGYRQFFRRAWLDKILDWQSERRGCWTLEEETQPSHPETEDVRLTDGQVAVGQRQEVGRSLRAKREERVLIDGCASHRTAVALAALGGYVRYGLEFAQQQQ